MEIRKMTADFGALRGATLELKSGLNIVRAPNESGKSTWCAFIRAMLYGVDSAQRAKAGVLPDKKRYAPWDGGTMAGEMELSWQGKDVTIARAGRASAPMRDFSAVYTGTGLAVPELTGTSAGETLTGVSRAVFESSAFIGQSALRVTQGPELEKRIASIVSTGDEDLSFTETKNKLSAWQRKRRWHNSGALPELEARLGEKAAALEALERSDAGCEALSARVDELERRCAALRAQVTESRKKARRENLARSSEAREALHRTERAATEARGREQALSTQLDEGRFGKTEPNQVAADVQETAARTRALSAQAADLPSGWPSMALLIAAAALAIAGVILLFVLPLPWGLASVVLGLLAGLVGLRGYRTWKQRIAAANAAAAERDQILQAFGVSDETELETAAQTHEALYRNWKAAEIEALRAERVCREARKRQSDLDAAVLEELDFAGGSGEAARLGRQLTAAEEELRQTREQLAAARGRADVMGDPMVLKSEIGALQERRAELEGQYDALSVALEALTLADQEIQTRFSPRLGARAAELFGQLTGGRYDRLALDKTLDVQARRTGETAGHAAAYLSAGACDQLYLALRIAICELAMPEGEPCPLILDDALGNFDDARCTAALDMLKTLARERQILLLSCHSREADYFAGDPAVHVTGL